MRRATRPAWIAEIALDEELLLRGDAARYTMVI